MAPSTQTLKTAALAFLAALAPFSSAHADPPQVVFKNGASILVSALSLQGNNLVVTGTVEGYTVGQTFPTQSADHVFGERPAEINQGIALLLLDNHKEAIKVLEPMAAAQRASAKIPGNFWLETAGALVVAYAINGNSQKVNDLGKEISESTPTPGVDPIVALGKTLLIPSSSANERMSALQELADSSQPADVSAYASYYIGNMLMESKKNTEALEAYLSVTCLYPSGGLILNSAAEIKAAGILTTLTRREEAVALLKSAQITSPGTVLAEQAGKSLESLK
jgi:tetratricopeptide (TPR) repeat protein